MTRDIVLTLSLLTVAASAMAAEPSASKPGADKDKLICRREVPVGSLIASRKMCLTKTQWDGLAQDGNDAARKMMWDNMGKVTGPGG